MRQKPVIAIVDVGKTNKKIFLFDEEYRMVWEQNRKFDEVRDEEGFPCEDLEMFSAWIRRTIAELAASEEFNLKAVNFSAYGASLVHLGASDKPFTPLYNYLKPFPSEVGRHFFQQHGTEAELSAQTATPFMGYLNTGLQLYLLKHQKPEVYAKIKHTLMLPQYLSYLFTGGKHTEITYIGSHSLLWDFQKNRYHDWVIREGIDRKIPSLFRGNEVLPGRLGGRDGSRPAHVFPAGVGLHDSSAALIPYLRSFSGPFAVISTGTWCISLNPFNHGLPTQDELKKGCLCYISYLGKPVKASMLFAGNDHEAQVRRIAGRFSVDPDFFSSVDLDVSLVEKLEERDAGSSPEKGSACLGGVHPSVFAQRDLSSYASAQEAYHRLIMDIVDQQVVSTNLVLHDHPVKKIFVDGGFCRNPIYMGLVGRAFPDQEVYAASLAQATALGAAMAIHGHWNSRELPGNLIELKRYSLSGKALI